MDDQLKQLLSYTQFHIGMYATLCTLLVVVLKLGGADIATYYYWLVGTLILFSCAGMFGGLVGSSIPHFTNFTEFSRAYLGPFRLRIVPAILCTHLEHLFFWAGMVLAVVGVLVTTPVPGAAKN